MCCRCELDLAAYLQNYTAAIIRPMSAVGSATWLWKETPWLSLCGHDLHCIVNSHAFAPQVSLEHGLLCNTGPAKNPLQLSVTAAARSPAGTILLGSGDGTLALLNPEAEANPANPKQLKKLGVITSIRLEGAITSIALDTTATRMLPLGRNPTAGGMAFTAYVGTSKCNIYRVAYDPVAKK